MVKKQIDIFVKFSQNVKDFSTQMKNNMERFKDITTSAGKANKQFKENRTALGRLGHRLRMATHGMRGFRMEMLGVMFFGMGIQKFFTGLLKPAMAMAGIFDILNTILGVVFLPIVLALLDPLLILGTWLMNLDESTKLWIGKMVLLGAAMGGALFIIGMLALGIGSIILVFGGFLGLIEKLIPGPMGDMTAAFVGLTGAMAAGSFVGRIWQKIKDTVSGLWKKIKEYPAVKELLEKFGLKVEDLEDPWKTLKRKVTEFFDKLKEELGLGDLDFETFKSELEKIMELLDDLKTIADEIMGTGLLQALGSAVGKISGYVDKNPRKAAGTAIGVGVGSPAGLGGMAVGGTTGFVAATLVDIYNELRDMNQKERFQYAFSLSGKLNPFIGLIDRTINLNPGASD